MVNILIVVAILSIIIVSFIIFKNEKRTEKCTCEKCMNNQKGSVYYSYNDEKLKEDLQEAEVALKEDDDLKEVLIKASYKRRTPRGHKGINKFAGVIPEKFDKSILNTKNVFTRYGKT